MQLSHKSILITGGNSGIGMDLVKQLHAMGNQIAVISRTKNQWDSLSQLDPKVMLLQCDISKKDQVLHLTQQLNEQKYNFDILFNCAAIQNTPMQTDKTFSFDKIETEIATNFSAPVWMSYLLLPMLMSRPNAMIVNLSSGLALYPKTTSAVYCATKAALHNFSQSLRYQLARTNIRIVEVILPLVDTPMTKGRGHNKISSARAAREIIHGIANKRDEVYVGKARLLPFIIRIWPGLVKRILKKY